MKMGFTFNPHPKLAGCHSLFSPSQSAWLRYDDDKLIETYQNLQQAAIGTKLHAWAAETIKLGIKQPRSTKTLSAYVNDAIGFRMQPEVTLFYSENFFGTADAISFRDRVLRIHDLKTGIAGANADEEKRHKNMAAHMPQLEIYAALFCLEYKIRPDDIEIELRIYKYDEVMVHQPDPEQIKSIMDRIEYMDGLINSLKLT